MEGIVPWKSDLAKLITKKLNQAMTVGEIVQVGEHVEITLDNVTYKLSITKKR